MAKSLFSVPIFFIAFRECLEASLIIAILLGLVEQIVATGGVAPSADSTLHTHSHRQSLTKGSERERVKEREADEEGERMDKKRLIRKLRIQVRPPPLPLLFLPTH